MLAEKSLQARKNMAEDCVFDEVGFTPVSPRSGAMPGIILTVESAEQQEEQHAEVISLCSEQGRVSRRPSRRSNQPYNRDFQRSPSATRMRRNGSHQKLREPTMNGGSGVSRSQSMRTSRRPQSVDPNYRFRHRISSIPSDMTLPADLLKPDRVDSNHSLPLPFDEDEILRLRNFSVTPKGVVNRGDSFRAKSRSTHSVASVGNGSHTPVHRYASDGATRLAFPTSLVSSRVGSGECLSDRPKTPEPEPEGAVALPQVPGKKLVKYRILVIGTPDVGKTSLTHQFMTSEYICSYDGSMDEENEKSVSVILNGEEAELVFVEHTFMDDSDNVCSLYSPDAYLVVYAVTNKRSLQIAKDIVRHIKRWDSRSENKAVILVGNKMDLARLRMLTIDDGRSVAIEQGCKFIETSAGINHHVDELLVGLLTQIRLKFTSADKLEAKLQRKRESVSLGPSGRSKTTNKCSGSSGFRAKGILKRILKKACSKSKSCDNLNVL